MMTSLVSHDFKMAESLSTPIPLKSELNFSSLTDDFNAKSNDEIANEMASDFSKFLNFNVAKEEVKFNDSVEMMLTKLDEFFSLVDMIKNLYIFLSHGMKIRSDTTLCISTTLPDILAKCVEMEAVFEKIDRLEEFVDIVKECVAATEEKVAKAEGDLGTVGGLMKKFTSLVSKKKSPVQSSSRGKRTEFVPAKIFSTEEFFDHSQETEQLNTATSPMESSFEIAENNVSS